jgi:hypothetical protein
MGSHRGGRPGASTKIEILSTNLRYSLLQITRRLFVFLVILQDRKGKLLETKFDVTDRGTPQFDCPQGSHDSKLGPGSVRVCIFPLPQHSVITRKGILISDFIKQNPS